MQIIVKILYYVNVIDILENSSTDNIHMLKITITGLSLPNLT